MPRKRRNRQRASSTRPTSRSQAIETNSLIATLRVRPASLASVLNLSDPTCIRVNVLASVSTQDSPDPDPDPDPDSQRRLIPIESLRKEIAELHLSNLDNSIDQLETHLANLTHRRAKAQNDKKTYQVTLDFHKANLGTAIERAYEGEISTLDPQPDDTPVITRTKKGIASLLNSVYIWERELRETLQNVMATEEEMDTVSDQLETLQKLREDIAKSL